jgi:hypothetical protein
MSAGLREPSVAAPASAGIFAIAPTEPNGSTYTAKDSHQMIAAANSPFTTGVLVKTQWDQIEPLPPGVNWMAKPGSAVMTLSSTNTVTLSCLNADLTNNRGNYCWDTIDQGLSILPTTRLSPRQYVVSGKGTITVPALVLGISVQAGFHSPAWLSDSSITVNTQPGNGITVNFPDTAVGSATISGSYTYLGTLSCSAYTSAAGVTFGSGTTPCGIGQSFTSWQGFQGGAGGGNAGLCEMVRLPIPYGTFSSGGVNNLAPYAQQYYKMIQALQGHLASTFPSLHIVVVKLGGVMAGQDTEFTLLGSNQLGTATPVVYATEADGTGLGTQVCPGPASSSNTTAFYSSAWQSAYAYNPRYVEQTFEYVANSVGTLFNNTSSGTSVLLNIDVHNDTKTTFPYIPFQESNSNTHTIYTTNPAGGNYSFSADGPDTQDDIIWCDMISASTNGTNTTLSLIVTGGNTITQATNQVYAGFAPTMASTTYCLTSGHTHSHQPLTFSRSSGYTWGIEEDGLEPLTNNAVPGPYAQGASRLGSLELSWGMNGGGSANCGQTVSGSTTASVDCTTAITQTSTCGTGPGGTSVVCYQAFESMLDSGLYSPSGANPTGQSYFIQASDLCNPYLWLGLASSNQSITGLNLATADFYSIGGTTDVFSSCSGSPGTFQSGGTFTQ